MPLIPPSSHALPPVDQLAIALGYQTWNTHPAMATAATAPTSGTPNVVAVYLPPGVLVTGIALTINTAGAGTVPTGFFVALTSATKMLVQSANLAASAALTTTGPQQFAFSSTYLTNVGDSPTGLYYAYWLQNGAFSVTQATVARGSGAGNSGRALAGQNPLVGSAGAGLTVPPANGQAVTIVAASLMYWAGVY